MKYRKRPVEIEAFLWTPGCDVPGWAKTKVVEDHGNARIATLEGTMTAAPGDYVIHGVEGEVYSCKPDIFEKTYECVDK